MHTKKSSKKSSTKSPSTTTSVKKRKSAPKRAASSPPGVDATSIISASPTAAPAPAPSSPKGHTALSTLPSLAGAALAAAGYVPSAANTATTPSVVDEPPSVTYPVIPATYVDPDSRELNGFYPNKLELAAMAGVVSDLNAFSDYAETLGNKVEPAATLAGWITRALSWRMLRNETEQWSAYVMGEDALSWKVALIGLDDLKPLFTFAATKDATLATKYPSLAKLFGASKTIAKAVHNAKVRKAAKAKKAAATAVTVSTATTASAAPAAAPSAPNPLAPLTTALAKVPGAS